MTRSQRSEILAARQEVFEELSNKMVPDDVLKKVSPDFLAEP